MILDSFQIYYKLYLLFFKTTYEYLISQKNIYMSQLKDMC